MASLKALRFNSFHHSFGIRTDFSGKGRTAYSIHAASGFIHSSSRVWAAVVAISTGFAGDFRTTKGCAGRDVEKTTDTIENGPSKVKLKGCSAALPWGGFLCTLLIYSKSLKPQALKGMRTTWLSQASFSFASSRD
jgi:hypothetical protein